MVVSSAASAESHLGHNSLSASIALTSSTQLQQPSPHHPTPVSLLTTLLTAFLGNPKVIKNTATGMFQPRGTPGVTLLLIFKSRWACH